MRVAILILLLSLAVPELALAKCCCEPDYCCCEIVAAQTPTDDFPLETLVFHLPLAFNDGAPVPEALLEDVLADVVELAGGFTYYEATGGWMHEGRLYREPVWVVKVGLQESMIDEFTELVETRLKNEFKQEAVWIEGAGEAAIL